VTVGVGFVTVIAVLALSTHLVAKVLGLVDIAVAQDNWLAAAPASVVPVELVGRIRPHHKALCVVGKREPNAGSHWLEKKP
jgi:hypothetical protein